MATKPSINAGRGDDTIVINANANGDFNKLVVNAALAVENSSIDLGSGNDQLFVRATASGAKPMLGPFATAQSIQVLAMISQS